MFFPSLLCPLYNIIFDFCNGKMLKWKPKTETDIDLILIRTSLSTTMFLLSRYSQCIDAKEKIYIPIQLFFNTNTNTNTYIYIYWFVVINLSNLFTSFEYYYWMEKNTEQNADTVKQCRAVWASIVRTKQIIKPPPIVYPFTKQLSNQQIR